MWGEWFGRPHDNVHTMKRCSAAGSTLVLEFDDGETLTVESPEGLEVSSTVFAIRSASAVRWEWFYYGRPHLPGNRYYYQFVRSGSVVEAETNVDWYRLHLSPSADQNAAELL